MKTTKGTETDRKFVEGFLKKYTSLGFGNLPKKEIDILVFGLISRLGYLEGKDYYEIAKELKIEEKRVKRLVIEDSLRNDTEATLLPSLTAIKERVFTTKKTPLEFANEKVSLLIEDPVERRDFIYAIRSVGYSFDENLNPDRISLPIYVFMTVFCRHFDDLYLKMKTTTAEKLKSDEEYSKAFNDGKPLLERVNGALKQIAEPIDSLGKIASLFGIKAG